MKRKKKDNRMLWEKSTDEFLDNNKTVKVIARNKEEAMDRVSPKLGWRIKGAFKIANSSGLKRYMVIALKKIQVSERDARGLTNVGRYRLYGVKLVKESYYKKQMRKKRKK